MNMFEMKRRDEEGCLSVKEIVSGMYDCVAACLSA